MLAAAIKACLWTTEAFAQPYNFTALAGLDGPAGLALDRSGQIYVADVDSTIRRLTPIGTNWVVSTIAGLAGNGGSEDGTNNAARFFSPFAVRKTFLFGGDLLRTFLTS